MQKNILENLKDKTDASGVKEFIEAKEKTNEILLQEETYWKQRAKLFWLK